MTIRTRGVGGISPNHGFVIPVIKLRKYIIPVLKLYLGLIFIQTGLDPHVSAICRRDRDVVVWVNKRALLWAVLLCSSMPR